VKWPWTKARDGECDGPDIEHAQRRLEALIAQRPDVDNLNDSLRRHRIENGFARKVFSLAPPKGDSR
jgi:hypothetical protein